MNTNDKERAVREKRIMSQPVGRAVLNINSFLGTPKYLPMLNRISAGEYAKPLKHIAAWIDAYEAGLVGELKAQTAEEGVIMCIEYLNHQTK